MKIQTKLNPVQSSQIQAIIAYTGLDLNTIVRVALQEYCQRQSQAKRLSGDYQPIIEVNTPNPLKSLDNSPPIDNPIARHNTKLLWPEWSALNPGKSNDEFVQYFIQDA